jgi:chorismate mutase
MTNSFGRLVSAVAAFSAVCGLAAPTALADDPVALSGLIDAAAQRLRTAEPVAAVKWQTNGSIEDAPRVQQVLSAVSTKASDRGIDPAYVSRAFTDQIHATEAIEYSRFADWKLDPASAPAKPPDLAASRAEIDSLNTVMVDQIAAHWDVLRGPACGPELESAIHDVSDRRQLDDLYQRALRFATSSYCG